MSLLQLSTLHDASHKMEEMDKRIIEYQAVIEELEKQVKSMQKERADLEMTLAAYKQKLVLTLFLPTRR